MCRNNSETSNVTYLASPRRVEILQASDGAEQPRHDDGSWGLMCSPAFTICTHGLHWIIISLCPHVQVIAQPSVRARTLPTVMSIWSICSGVGEQWEQPRNGDYKHGRHRGVLVSLVQTRCVPRWHGELQRMRMRRTLEWGPKARNCRGRLKDRGRCSGWTSFLCLGWAWLFFYISCCGLLRFS